MRPETSSARAFYAAKMLCVWEGCLVMEVFFDLPGGERQVVSASLGRSLMDVAVKAGVPGILAECGGACACATCHVQVEAQWYEKLDAASPLEVSMMEFLDEVTPTSRLACQITLTEDLAGLVVFVPAE